MEKASPLQKYILQYDKSQVPISYTNDTTSYKVDYIDGNAAVVLEIKSYSIIAAQKTHKIINTLELFLGVEKYFTFRELSFSQ
jgi:hypothetical protein